MIAKQELWLTPPCPLLPKFCPFSLGQKLRIELKKNREIPPLSHPTLPQGLSGGSAGLANPVLLDPWAPHLLDFPSFSPDYRECPRPRSLPGDCK